MSRFAPGDDVAVYLPGVKWPLYGQVVKTVQGQVTVHVYWQGKEASITVDEEIVKRWKGGTPK